MDWELLLQLPSSSLLTFHMIGPGLQQGIILLGSLFVALLFLVVAAAIHELSRDER